MAIRGRKSEAVLKGLTALIKISGGQDYILVMEHYMYNRSGREHYDYSIHPRYQMPCLGELRKYASTHPDDCTQPGNRKPGDLHHPFPEGHPAALAIQLGVRHVPGGAQRDQFYREAFSDESPFKTGFGGSGNVIFVEVDCDPQYPSMRIPGDWSKGIYAFILKDLDIDPTVLVNMRKFLSCTHVDAYYELRDAGATIKEALGIMYINSGDPMWVIGNTSTYQGPSRFSAKRWFESNPIDLTGGTLADRFDYNRTRMADPFYSVNGLHWSKEMNELLPHPIISPNKMYRFKGDNKGPAPRTAKEVLEAARKVFEKHLEKEVFIDTPFEGPAPKKQGSHYPSKNPLLGGKVGKVVMGDIVPAAIPIDLPDDYSEYEDHYDTWDEDIEDEEDAA